MGSVRRVVVSGSVVALAVMLPGLGVALAAAGQRVSQASLARYLVRAGEETGYSPSGTPTLTRSAASWTAGGPKPAADAKRLRREGFRGVLQENTTGPPDTGGTSWVMALASPTAAASEEKAEFKEDVAENSPVTRFTIKHLPTSEGLQPAGRVGPSLTSCSSRDRASCWSATRPTAPTHAHRSSPEHSRSTSAPHTALASAAWRDTHERGLARIGEGSRGRQREWWIGLAPATSWTAPPASPLLPVGAGNTGSSASGRPEPRYHSRRSSAGDTIIGVKRDPMAFGVSGACSPRSCGTSTQRRGRRTRIVRLPPCDLEWRMKPGRA